MHENHEETAVASSPLLQNTNQDITDLILENPVILNRTPKTNNEIKYNPFINAPFTAKKISWNKHQPLNMNYTSNKNKISASNSTSSILTITSSFEQFTNQEAFSTKLKTTASPNQESIIASADPQNTSKSIVFIDPQPDTVFLETVFNKVINYFFII